MQDTTLSSVPIPPWPIQMPYPSGQSSMDNNDWIDLIEAHLVEIDEEVVDRDHFEYARRDLLALRRYHYAAEGIVCPRWPMKRADA